MKKLFILLLVLTGLTLLSAQIVTIDGNVAVATPSGGFLDIVGAEISIGGAAENVYSDSTGYYSITFEWLWDGPVNVTCSAYSYSTESVSFLPESNNVTVNFELTPFTTNTIMGTVHGIDENGNDNPIENAEVTVFGALEPCMTDSEGNYSISFNWDWDSAVEMLCTKMGYISQTHSFYPNETTSVINFQLIPDTPPLTHTISGLVTYEDLGGMMFPIDGANVTVTAINLTDVTDSLGFYSTTFEWIWNGPIVMTFEADGYHTQTQTFFPDSQDHTLDILMFPDNQPEPTVIEGYVRMSYPNSDQTITGAEITLGDGIQVLTSTLSSDNGFYSSSLIWNWWGPIYITCHYPGFNHITMDYLPDETINTLNFYMQLLPPIFLPPSNLVGQIDAGYNAHIAWDPPENWPLDIWPMYRIYFRNSNSTNYHAVAETADNFHDFVITPDQSGNWYNEIAITAFAGDIETSFSDYIALSISVENSDNLLQATPLNINAYPNPFNPTSNISLNIPSTQHVNVSIFNIKGQEVITLADRTFQAGNSTLSWIGKDSHGKSVGSGIYLVRVLSENGQRITKKITLIK